MKDKTSLISNYVSDPTISRDMFLLMCGDIIGRGSFRDVFQYNLNSNWVVKIQRNNDEFSNIKEFEIWCFVKGTEFEKYFAPCYWMSPDGKVLLQHKTKPITKIRRPPEFIPSFFTDVKDDNFGFIGRRFVAHDYDFTFGKVLKTGLTKRMKKYKSHLKE